MTQCKNCQFARDEQTEEGISLCHRFPPILDAEEDDTDSFPRVYDDDWCGEYRRKEVGNDTKIDG